MSEMKVIYKGKWDNGFKDGDRIGKYVKSGNLHILDYGHGEMTIKRQRHITKNVKEVYFRETFKFQ